MASKLTDLERLSVLEANVVNLTKSVDTLALNTKEGFDNINKKLDEAIPQLVSEARLEEKLQPLRTEIKNIKRRTIVQNTLSAVLGSVLTLLISFFFYTISK